MNALKGHTTWFMKDTQLKMFMTKPIHALHVAWFIWYASYIHTYNTYFIYITKKKKNVWFRTTNKQIHVNVHYEVLNNFLT